MEILTEFDGLQEALKKVNMDEAVLPYCNGRLIDDKAWNKTQKILNCPEMISAHKFLYNLDMDQLTEEEIAKIDQLYKLGCDRGFLVDDLTDWDAETPDNAAKVEEKPVEQAKQPVGGTLFKAKVPCWTVIYSATSKDGDIKTGEAYSNAISASAAKADVNAKLSRIGYGNISILAIEAADPDCCKVDSSTVDNTSIDTTTTTTDTTAAKTPIDAQVSEEDKVEEDLEEEEEEDVLENDLLKGFFHNAHVDETDEEESEEEESEESEEESEEEADEESEEESEEEESEEDDESTEEKEESDEETDEESKDDTEEDEEESEDEESTDANKEELDANQKAELKDKYRKTFKNVLVKCKFETSFNDLTLEQKVKFFTELAKAWTKNEPTEFMTDKETEQLNNIVVKPENDD